jgi:hypothetical protein
MYGLKQARYNWYSTFIDELLKVRFKQNAVDKCLFIRNNFIIIVYVDDCLLFSQSHSVLDEMIKFFNTYFKITLSSSIVTYLGLEVTHNANGS